MKGANVELTMMDILEAQELAVLNFLVGLAGIESVAVRQPQGEAEDLLTGFLGNRRKCAELPKELKETEADFLLQQETARGENGVFE